MENIGFIQTNRWNFSIIGLDNPFYKFQVVEEIEIAALKVEPPLFFNR